VLPCTCILQPTLAHLYQISSLLPGPFPILASASLRLLYLLLYSEHINHIQVLGFLPFPYSFCMCSPLSVWPMSNNITAFVQVYNLHMRENKGFLAFWAWLTSLKMKLVSNSIHLLVNDKISIFFPSIYLWMTKFQFSLWLNKTPLCINTTF
jgi:hypothetical protein